jgi:hypothetical protein
MPNTKNIFEIFLLYMNQKGTSPWRRSNGNPKHVPLGRRALGCLVEQLPSRNNFFKEKRNKLSPRAISVREEVFKCLTKKYT